MARYSVKLLFQFRTVRHGKSNTRRICEERILSFESDSPALALKIAKERGLKEEHSYQLNDKDVHFEFIGVEELIALGVEADPDEVWWQLVERVRPMERRQHFIPDEQELSALRTKTKTHGRLKL